MTRLLAIAVSLVLAVQLLSLAAPLLGPAWSRRLLRWRVAMDVSGGVIMLAIVGSLIARGEPGGAALVGLIGIPVFLGAYRALPAWWRGEGK